MASTIRGDDNFDSAGPFGITELITAKTNFTNVGAVTQTLGTEYGIHVIEFFNVTHNLTTTSSEDFEFRLGNSSGSIITTSTYDWRRDANVSVSSNDHIEIANTVYKASTSNIIGAIVYIYNAADSSARTYVRSSSIWETSGYAGQMQGATIGTEDSTQRNANCQFSIDGGYTFSGSYRAWGIRT
jgi:hypothetical protein